MAKSVGRKLSVLVDTGADTDDGVAIAAAAVMTALYPTGLSATITFPTGLDGRT